jgi:membrane-associated phospholipid phosphatase
MHAGIGGGFLMKGQISDNPYAYNTGMMIWHGMVVSTIYNQIIKRSTGRESPNVKTSERGSWNLFPSFNEYNSKTANYDAVPSGHVMTATLTFTIISERYPEYNKYTYPIAGVWVSALMFQMVNNGVHWASDYPLGIAMGYVFGKAATQMTKTSSTDLKDVEKTSWRLQPTFNGIYAVKNF